MIIDHWIVCRIRHFSYRRSREKQNTNFRFNNFIEKSHHLWENVEKHCIVRQVTVGIMWHIECVCWIAVARIQADCVLCTACAWQHVTCLCHKILLHVLCLSWSVGHWLSGQQQITQKRIASSCTMCCEDRYLCCGHKRVKNVCYSRLKA